MPKTKKVEIVEVKDGGLRVIGRDKTGEPTFMAKPAVVLHKDEIVPTNSELALLPLTKIRVAPEVLSLFAAAVGNEE